MFATSYILFYVSASVLTIDVKPSTALYVLALGQCFMVTAILSRMRANYMFMTTFILYLWRGESS